MSKNSTVKKSDLMPLLVYDGDEYIKKKDLIKWLKLEFKNAELALPEMNIEDVSRWESIIIGYKYLRGYLKQYKGK